MSRGWHMHAAWCARARACEFAKPSAERPRPARRESARRPVGSGARAADWSAGGRVGRRAGGAALGAHFGLGGPGSEPVALRTQRRISAPLTRAPADDAPPPLPPAVADAAATATASASDVSPSPSAAHAPSDPPPAPPGALAVAGRRGDIDGIVSERRERSRDAAESRFGTSRELRPSAHPPPPPAPAHAPSPSSNACACAAPASTMPPACTSAGWCDTWPNDARAPPTSDALASHADEARACDAPSSSLSTDSLLDERRESTSSTSRRDTLGRVDALGRLSRSIAGCSRAEPGRRPPPQGPPRCDFHSGECPMGVLLY